MKSKSFHSVFHSLLMGVLLSACSQQATSDGSEAPPAALATDAGRPNIILIMVDDMGYSDIGLIGGDIETPNIDRLANEGLLFEQFYNNAKCSQTRASLLSGLYYQQARKSGPMGNPGHDQLAQPNNTTIAEVLKGAGYATAMTGKWHISGTPYERGFEKFYGFLEGSQSHWDSAKVFGDYRPEAETFYTTDEFTNAGISFLASARESARPVFLYMAYTAPHYPLHASEEDIAIYAGRYADGWDAVRNRRIAHMKENGLIDASFTVSPRLIESHDWDLLQKGWQWDGFSAAEQAEQQQLMAVYAAMIHRLDINIGRLINEIDRLGMRDNSVIFFLSDNGGSAYSSKDEPEQMPGPPGTFRTLNTPWAEVNSAPFRLFKRYAHEGGIATPMIAYWPAGLVNAGRRSKAPFHVIDFMPSLIELAQSDYPQTRYGDPVLPMAGISFVPVIRNEPAEENRRLYWEYQKNYAMREGKWKLVQSNLEGQWELYDMDLDRGETNNLADQHPQILQSMLQAWQYWSDAVNAKQPFTKDSDIRN